MRTFAQQQTATLEVTSASPARYGQAFFGQRPEVRSILHFHRMIGNQAVQRLVQANAAEFEADSGGSTPPRFTHDFSRIPLHAQAHPMILPELTINAPGDRYEQEADRVADTVMRMRKPDLALGGSDSGRSASARIQRDCSECGEQLRRPLDETEDENEMIAAKSGAVSINSKPGAPGLHAALGTGGSGGHGLPAAVRGFFEPRFGHDFGKVRVHADNTAAELARGFNARAFTVGNDIYFGARQYAPGTFHGDKLLAHELTHTIQQSRGGSRAIRGALGWTAPIALSSAPSSIQRKEAVLAPSVTTENPLDRLLKGEPAGLTTPFVNGVEFNNIEKMSAALPTKLSFAAGSAANTCKVAKPIDIISQAKIITASAPGKNGWTASAPFAVLNKIGRITNKACAAKKDNITVRLVAERGNEAFAKWVRQAEGEHAAVITENHNKYLKPYHDFVNSTEGSHTDRRECAIGLAKAINAKRSEAIVNWAKAWGTSVDKLDSAGGPHRPELSFKVVGKCAEVLGTIKR